MNIIVTTSNNFVCQMRVCVYNVRLMLHANLKLEDILEKTYELIRVNILEMDLNLLSVTDRQNDFC